MSVLFTVIVSQPSCPWQPHLMFQQVNVSKLSLFDLLGDNLVVIMQGSTWNIFIISLFENPLQAL